MSLADDLTKDVKKIFSEHWSKRKGQKVPETEDIKLVNDGMLLDGTILYADLDGSTNLVDNYEPEFAAEIYKSYLHCTAKIIRYFGGSITSFDGDRIMAVYIGDTKNTSAAKTALKINFAVMNIINPAIEDQYSSKYEIKQVVGVDTSKILVARTGIRGSNDLVWVDRAPNYSAKLTSLSSNYSTRITKQVFEKLHKSAKYSEGKLMWEKVILNDMNKIEIYRSNWWWGI